MANINNADDNTIISGTNDADVLTNTDGSNVTIYGYNGNDVIEDYNTDNNDHNVIFAGDDDNLVISHSNNSTINAGNGNDSIFSSGSNVNINAGDGDNQIGHQTGTIISGSGNDSIFGGFSTSGNSFINAGAGNNFIQCGADYTSSDTIVGNATVIADNGNDTVYAIYLYDSSLYSGDGDDYIWNIASSNLTINAGTGNDSIAISSYLDNSNIFETKDFISYNEGDGNDTISGYSTNDTLQINSGSTPSTVASGNDIIINVGSGSIRLVDATETSITAINSSGDAINFSAGESTSTVPPVNTDTAVTDTAVTSGWATLTSSDNSTVIADSVNTANGTSGDDKLYISTINADRSAYGNGGSDLFSVTAGDGGTIYGGASDDTVHNLAEHVLIFAGDGNNSIQNGDKSNNSYGFYSGIFTGNGDDTIRNYGYDVTIDSGNGDDYVLSDVRSDKEFFRSATIYGSAGNDTIEVNDNETSVNGGAGNDVVSISSSFDWKNHTLQGGIGDDTIYGGGSNIFLYTEGDGNDTVYNFADNDTIQVVANSAYDSIVSDDNVLITIGDGSILLIGAANKSINVHYGYGITVDLNSVSSSTGFFTVSDITLPNGEIALDSTAKFSTAIDSNTTLVGTVDENQIYVAEDRHEYRQTILISDGWNVTATTNDDSLQINGLSATVTGGDGADTFSLQSDTQNVTLMDLDIDEDKLSFGNYITPGTMRQSIEDNHLVLSADDLRIDIPTMGEMTDEFLEYNVSNAGNSNTIRELIYGDGKAIISFARWSFTFTQSSLENF